ncbi:MAG: DUF2080 family transposase-associated protein [archaeon]
MEIIKTAIKVGNSAGVLLPKAWLNSSVKIILEPLNIEKEILEIISAENILKNTLGVYITGSYSRNEETIESDIDILVITSDLNKRIKHGKYEIICISEKEVERQLNENALPILPMILEAKAVINEDLIKRYSQAKLDKKNLKWHINTTKSAMNVVKASIKLSKEMKTMENDSTAYSLILRLRTLYIIDCIRKNKMWGKKEFLKLIKIISGSLVAYERYTLSKNKNTRSNLLPVEDAERLMDYINEKVEELRKNA